MGNNRFQYKVIILTVLAAAAFLNIHTLCIGDVFDKVEKIEADVEAKNSEAQDQIDLLNDYYNKGRECLYRKDFDGAAENFEAALKILPSYEPAKRYLGLIESDRGACLIGQHYNKSKIYLAKGDYKNAVSNLEEALKIAPSHEPLKKYFNTVLILEKINMDQGEIASIKTKMADIIADYDAKIKGAEGLGLAFLLEQALLRCQSGDFAGAEYYYNLCYKLDPSNKEKISWFVDTTHKLKDLYKDLDESYKKIEELSRAK